MSNFYWTVLLLAASAAGNNQGVRAVESSNLLPIDQVSPSCLISIRSNENVGTISLTTLVFLCLSECCWSSLRTKTGPCFEWIEAIFAKQNVEF
jgi:hypothetical protein